MPLVQTRAAAQQLCISEDTLSRLVARGAIPAPSAIGTAHVWDQEDIDAVQTRLNLDIALVAPSGALADNELLTFGAYANPFGDSGHRHALRPGSLGLVRGGRLRLFPVVRFEIVDGSGTKPALDTSPGHTNSAEAVDLYNSRGSGQPLIVAFLDMATDQRKQIGGIAPIRGGRYVHVSDIENLLAEPWSKGDKLRELGTLA